MSNRLIFVDEKGPQEHIKAQDHPDLGLRTDDPRRRFSLGSDGMTNYVMAAVDIPESQLAALEAEFLKIEAAYRQSSHNFKGEIKGARLLKGKQFELGFGSMRSRELDLYTKVFELLSKHDVKVCIVTQNKAASIITQRIHNWIRMASHNVNKPYPLVAYVLAKHFVIEADPSILMLSQNNDISTYRLLKTIKADLKEYLRSPSNRRTETQREVYQVMVKMLSKTLNLKTHDSPQHAGEFEWEKVDFSIGIWQDERYVLGERNDYKLFLDQGISPEKFDESRYSSITGNCHSDQIVGIRIADLVATMVGKLMTELSLSVLYDPLQPSKTVRRNVEWFDLNDEQLKLSKLLFNLIIATGLQYSFNNDTYFDDAVGLQAYLMFLSEYANAEELKNTYNRSEKEFEYYMKDAQQRFELMEKLPEQAKGFFGGISEAVDQKMLKPL